MTLTFDGCRRLLINWKTAGQISVMVTWHQW